MDGRTESHSSIGHQARNPKKKIYIYFILERIAVTVTAIGVCFNESLLRTDLGKIMNCWGNKNVDIYTTEVKLDDYIYFVSVIMADEYF